MRSTALLCLQTKLNVECFGCAQFSGVVVTWQMDALENFFFAVLLLLRK